MHLLYRRCAGLDVHKKSISVCVRIRESGSQEVKVYETTFGTFTRDLERLRQWLKEHRVKQVAMESTGVYWIPPWNILEPADWRFELLLVNPATVRALRGCKTDRIDARRICEYLQYGLLRGSFVPPRAIRQLRDTTRMRVQIQCDRNRVINRIGRLLETANLKLGSVASNIVGKSGRAILQAIVRGESKPEELAELALGHLRAKIPELILALRGRLSEHFRWLLKSLMAELDWHDARLTELDARLGEQMEPHREVVKRLCTIPGVDRITAWILISELGLDMSQFPDAAHAASWAGLCPGNAESGGKRFSGKTRKGNRYLRRILVQSAWAAARSKNCLLAAVFHRVAHRRGLKKAAVAVAHRILILAYHIIRDGSEYREMGGDYFDRLHPQRTAERLLRRLQNIGYEVTLKPREAPPDGDIKPRGRGRPCKCAERGVPCIHGNRAPQEARRASPPPARTPPRRPRTDEPNQQCARCGRWGIPCIHVKPRISRINWGARSPADAPESTT